MKELKRILLAEDDSNDIELTLTGLGVHGLANRVEVVRDGAAALDYLYRRGAFAARPAGNPIVVLLDLKMPKVNGLEVLQKMKSDPALKTIPVVVLTTSRDGPDIKYCYEYGANAYVMKPVDFGEFTKAVGTLGVFWAALNEPPE